MSRSGSIYFVRIGAQSRFNLPRSELVSPRLRLAFDSLLRSEFNSDIPAILITGDTAPDRTRDAVISDCLLMHKPVSDNRLRAAITNLTAEAP